MSRPHNHDDLDDELHRLFSRVTADIAPPSDLTGGVQQRLARSHTAHLRPAVGRAPFTATLSAFLVVALLAGVFVWLRPAQPTHRGAATATATVTPIVAIPASPPCVPQIRTPAAVPPVPTVPPNPPDHSAVVNRSTTVQGITWHIRRAYADATRTVISFEVLPNSARNPLDPDQPVLTDAHGNRYPLISGEGSENGPGYFDFVPLPLDELGTSQTLTVSTQRMMVSTPTGANPYIKGPWQITFTITPVTGQVFPLRLAPVTHDGLSIQPLEVETVPAGGGLDGLDSGLRLTLRLSGLDPRTSLADPIDGIGGWYTVFSGGGTCGGSVLVLIPRSGPVVYPGFVMPVDAGAPKLGPGGILDEQVLFFNWTGIEQAPVTLGIDRVNIPVPGTQNVAPGHVYVGPWTFTLALS